MEKYICIHCHFYQPARENPWLEAIEVQDSAYPFYDWNERITAESYAPNAASRILDDADRIIKIVNNYSRISFNFGATLLDWMESRAPETYEAILEADKESQRIFSGHGSAIAQAHSHIILPLANRRDKETQIIWGIADFEERFERVPEGMWLPETAVDVETLEVLAERGIKFTILAANQASVAREGAVEPWQDVSGGRIDSTRPYKVILPSGNSVVIFFYNGPISRAVAFERLLGRGEDFSNRLLSGFRNDRSGPQLVHIATDGETYGHHHRHGDMALAWALDHLEKNSEVELTNYGQFLEKYPPSAEVEIAELTSWSCSHGVERWRSDCGCNSGAEPGWNQAWRGPLRTALDWLRDEVAPRYASAAEVLLTDPWQARNDYVSVISKRSPQTIDDFVERHARTTLDPSQKTTVLELMELQRYAQLMYTSCGWFFDDVSGIETVQVIEYATRVVQLAENRFDEDFETSFLFFLANAKSNVTPLDGREIYLSEGKPAIVDLPRVGAHYAISSLFEDYSERNRIYCYQIDRKDFQMVELGRARAAIGRIGVTSEITGESSLLCTGVLYMGDLSVSGGIRQDRGDADYQGLLEDFNNAVSSNDLAAIVRLLDKHFGEQTFSMRSLFRDEQRRIINQVWNSGIADAEAAYKQLYEEHRAVMLFQSDLNLPLPRIFRLTAEVSLNLSLRRAAEQDEVPLMLVQRLLNEARRFQIPLDEHPLSYRFQHMVEKHARALQLEPDDIHLMERLDDAVTLVQLLPFEVPLWKVQNAYHRTRRTVFSDTLARAAAGNAEAIRWVAQFRALGSKLSFGVV